MVTERPHPETPEPPADALIAAVILVLGTLLTFTAALLLALLLVAVGGVL